MKFKCLLLVAFMIVTWASISEAQVPHWVRRLPEPKKGKFYYRMTVAEGNDYKEAYAEAFAMAIYESYSKLNGIPVEIGSDYQTIKEKVSETISLPQNIQTQIPINKVCEFQERAVLSGKWRLYVLWQVANNALEDPQFENFNKCE